MRPPVARSRWIIAGGVLLVIAVGAVWTRSARTAPVVAIGFARVSARVSDVSSFRAVQLAVETLNREAGGSVVFEARQPGEVRSDPVRAAAQLRSDPQVMGVVGPLRSQEMLDAIPEYTSAGRTGVRPVVGIATIATSPDLSGVSPWVFRLPPTDDSLASAAARFAFDSLRARRAMILTINDAYGNDWTRVFQGRFNAMGGRVIARAPAFIGDSTEWALYIAYARKLRPDLIVLPSVDSATATWVLRLRQQGIAAPIMAGDAAAFLDGGGRHYPSLFYVGYYDHDHPAGAAGAAFVHAFERRHGGERARQIPAFAYDAALTIGRAVIAVGPDRRRVRDYLEKLGTAGVPALDGATGTIAFDDRHNRRDPLVRLSRAP